MSDWQAKLTEGLTDAQHTAVTHVDGPLLVLAGPGSGKTRVITHRVAYLVAQGIPAWSILALTFTNKAAGEMRQRIDDMLPEDVPGRRGLTVATFHSFCARLLRRYAAEAHLPERFSIYDSKDQRDAVKKAIADAGLSTKNWTPAAVQGAISDAKNRLQTAADFTAEATDFYTRSIAKAYSAYEKRLKDNDALDFDDLLLRVANLLKTNEQLRSELQERFQYILIDEYQDTNHVQFIIARLLAMSHHNLCVVGDPDQSIYGWRGADLRNILDFEELFPETTIVPLGENFRSTGHILAAADHLIRHNTRRKDKTLETMLDDGARPEIIFCDDEHHEARLVVDSLRNRQEQGVSWRQMAVLYRMNALSRVMEEALRDAQIPYVIAQGTAFYDRKEIKDALSYLRLIVNPRDEVALLRVINTPTRGIGKTTIDRIAAHATQHGMTFIDALHRAGEIDGLSARAVNSIRKFLSTVESWRRADDEGGFMGAVDSSALAELVERVIHESGLDASFRKTQTEEDVQRLDNLHELVSAAAQFEPDEEANREAGRDVDSMSVLDWLAAYLESVALVSDSDAIDPGNGAVTLMTLHAAKGLEFDTIAMIGLEQGILPHSRSATDDKQLEEERRLCFVGMTRAERYLLITSATMRTMRGMRERQMLSQFIRELPESHVVTSDQATGYTSRSRTGDFEPWDDGPNADDFIDAPHTDDVATVDRSSNAGRRRATSQAGGEFKVGSMVRHNRFGLGRVEAIERHRSGSRATVDFQAGGRKTLILEYAQLERV